MSVGDDSDSEIGIEPGIEQTVSYPNNPEAESYLVDEWSSSPQAFLYVLFTYLILIMPPCLSDEACYAILFLYLSFYSGLSTPLFQFSYLKLILTSFMLF
ncbi:hypothetical protein L873DRAFT_806388 [Choiromyces venosus 120613-1]|uniref:Uncharacterized protein n=1 Tax=Choiromyces venosus 120613-1 TaxID=1336337 RepID=A0A3N4K872_9PEZI|nr:hypothetical protein L873DRAFT_806388 [Choiromyces venosus 120613-1]